MHKIGIDLGGTKIEGIVLDPEGNEVARQRIGTEQEKGYDHILSNIKSLHDNLVAEINGSKNTFGIGTPGSLSVQTNLLKGSNTVCMNGKPMKDDIEQVLGRKIAIENDANCFAMAEALFGAGKGKDVVFGVIMGTGCGGGLVVDGKVHSGVNNIAGEWGHMSIDPNGPTCYCGANGCVETFISGGGLERRYKREYGEERKLRDIEEDYFSGDKQAGEFFEPFFKHFGRCMANLINILDPDIVVLGGGVSKFKDIYTKGVAETEKAIFNDCLKTPIVQHEVGDSAGVLGAALIGI
jgi:fructokinase